MLELPMNKKTNIMTALTACLLILPAAQQALAEGTFYKEYEIKAAFMYQLVNFIDGWGFQQDIRQRAGHLRHARHWAPGL